MYEGDINYILEFIMKFARDFSYPWRLEGSANLFVQGVPVTVNDIDIVTDPKGYDFFKKALRFNIVKESYVKEKKQQSLLCKIRNHDVEVLYYDGNELMMLEKVIRIKWKNLFLSVLPLPHARNFYSMIGRIDKVSAIDTYLKRTKKT